MERDWNFPSGAKLVIISTHTLTWSVTTIHHWVRSFVSDFNSHAHVERDQDTYLADFDVVNFNSHAHVERDSLWAIPLTKSPISTHTLTWSVTGDGLNCPIGMCISTHTLTWSVT